MSEGHESVQHIDKVAGINPSWIIYQAGDLAINYIRCHHAHPLDETICNIKVNLSPLTECQACDIAGRNSEQCPLRSMQAKFCHQPEMLVHYTFQFSTHFIWNTHFICSIAHFKSQILFTLFHLLTLQKLETNSSNRLKVIILLDSELLKSHL